MRIVLSTPSRKVQRTGNRCTARQWADLFAGLGHEVRIVEIGDEEDAFDSDYLVVLHAGRSHEVVRAYREARASGRVVVALTGTDIYPRADEKVLETLRMADAIVVLQEKALEQIPPGDRGKARVIFQGAEAHHGTTRKSAEFFDVCVVGHLRDVKDPLRAAAASRLLPPDSRIRISHAGGILDERYEELVRREQEENPRYLWLGELDEEETARLIASSHLLALTSFSEGGARVVGEACVNGTPVISSFIDGVRGLLGDDYRGYHEAGNTEELSRLLSRAEREGAFLAELQSGVDAAAPRFAPEREADEWRLLLNGLMIPSGSA